MSNQKLFPCPYYVIGGGESGGKTTGLARLPEFCAKHGYVPLFIPEAATLLFNKGIDFRSGSISPVLFQEQIVEEYLHHEASVIKTAEEMISKGLKPIIFSDRSIVDSKIYLTDHEYTQLLRKFEASHGLSHNFLLARPDAYFHLVTAADGATKYYKQTTTRTQTPQEAIDNDRKLFSAYVGTNHVRRITNDNDFDHKMNRFEHLLLESLGLPVPIERERKFLIPLKDIEKMKEQNDYHVFGIEQRYLLSSDTSEPRIRKLIAHPDTNPVDVAFFLTKKEDTDDSEVRIETNKRILKDGFYALKDMQIPGSRTIEKKRHYTFENHMYMEIDAFTSVQLPEHEDLLNTPTAMLEVELTEKGQELQLPSWVSRYVEVTADPRYRNKFLALSKNFVV